MIKNREIILKTFLFLFALLINQYYGNRGLFPHDSASHFDTGYRVLFGDYPIKDYWIISGFIIDYMQSLIFYLFGVNWQTYVLHASLFNGILTISLFFLFKHFGLKLENNFFFCFCFAVLAYPSSGTPFVDHHSTFFSMLAIILTFFALDTNKIIYWFFIPVLLVMSFLSKPVPAVYIIAIILIITFLHILIFKNYKSITYLFLGSSFSIIIFFLILKFTNTEFYNFWEQYVLYPQTIGLQRFNNLNIDLIKILSHFKFIFLSLLPILFIFIKNIFIKKKYFKNLQFYYLIILITFTFSLIFHQVFTKNQTYIFFMVPVLLGVTLGFIKIKRPIIFLMILFCFIVTLKYHIRFNENRKFHELVNVEFTKAGEASIIDKKLSGLKWITPQFSEKPKEEIDEILKIKNILLNEKDNYMFLTNYSFFTAILEKNTLSTTRWHTFDGTDYPREKNKFFRSYRNIFIKTINKNNVNKIYITKPIKSKDLYKYLDKDCLVRKKILDSLIEHKLICKNL